MRVSLEILVRGVKNETGKWKLICTDTGSIEKKMFKHCAEAIGGTDLIDNKKNRYELCNIMALHNCEMNYKRIQGK